MIFAEAQQITNSYFDASVVNPKSQKDNHKMCYIAADLLDLRDFSRIKKDKTIVYMVLVRSGYENSADVQLSNEFATMIGHFPRDKVLKAHLFSPEECSKFLSAQDISSAHRPIIFISEDSPFEGHFVKKRAVLEVGKLGSSDEIKHLLSSLSSLAVDDTFLKKAKFDELLRQLERNLGKFGGPLKDCLSMIGVG